MLWRIVAGSALPGGLATAMLIEGVRRASESRGDGASADQATAHIQAHFVCDKDGNVSIAHTHEIISLDSTLSRSAMGAVIETVVTAATVTTEFASSAAAATADAASRAATSTVEAATWVAETASSATSRLKRTVTNEDINAELKAQAKRANEILEALNAHKRADRYFEQMKAMFAVGMAIAAADGEISAHEQGDIRDFVAGAAYAALPSDIRAALQHWITTPPSIEEAFNLARKCGEESLPFFDGVIEVAINADEEVHPAELLFKERWKEMRDEVIA